MDRTPPPDVRRRLRQEVGFGCPVDGCDSPYLSWHHFDPPWAEGEHQNPAGMIALCVLHHGQADAGAFTVDQLRMLKDAGRNRAAARLAGRFLWRRERLILLAGGNWWTGCEVLVQVRSTPIIWLTRDDDGYELLNLDLFDARGVPRLRLRDNDWIADRGVDDLECTPRKPSLMVRTAALGAELSVSFERASRSAVERRATEIARHGRRQLEEWTRRRDQAYLERFGTRPTNLAPPTLPTPEEEGGGIAMSVLAGIAEEESALCVIEGQLRWPVEVAFGPAQMVLPGQNTFIGGVMRGGRVGIQFG